MRTLFFFLRREKEFVPNFMLKIPKKKPQKERSYMQPKVQ